MNGENEKPSRIIDLDKIDAAAAKLRSNPELLADLNEAIKKMIDKTGIELNIHERRYLLQRTLTLADPERVIAGYVGESDRPGR